MPVTGCIIKCYRSSFLYCFDDCGGRTLSTMWVLVIRNTIACDTYSHSLQTIQWPFLSYRWGHCRPGHFCTIEMLHCRLKMIARNICVLICNNLFLLADTWTQTVLWKLSHWIYLLLRGSGFSFILSPIRMFIHSLMFTQEFKLWVNLGGSKDQRIWLDRNMHKRIISCNTINSEYENFFFSWALGVYPSGQNLSCSYAIVKRNTYIIIISVWTFSEHTLIVPS